jgi:hypothetical protein
MPKTRATRTIRSEIPSAARRPPSSGGTILAAGCGSATEFATTASAGESPIGPTLPAFTVHDVYGGVRLYQRGRIVHSLTASLTNIGNELYAEFPNASFFRPEPGRSIAVAYRIGF